MPCAERKLTICTPYFNLPALLVRNIIQLLRSGKQVELSLAIKLRMTSIFLKISRLRLSAPSYLYEINLRRFPQPTAVLC